MQCSAAQYSTVQCSLVQCSFVQCSFVQCSAVQCSVLQCSAAQYRAYKAVDTHATGIPAAYKRKAANNNMNAAMGVPEEAAAG